MLKRTKKYFILLSFSILVVSNFVTFKLTQLYKNNNGSSASLEEIYNSSKNDEEYIKSLEEQVSTYNKKLSELEANNERNTKDNQETNSAVKCLELVKKTPNRGSGSYMNIDIVGFYNDAKSRYDSLQEGKYTREDPEDNKAELEFWTDIYNEAKPLYESYAKECL